MADAPIERPPLPLAGATGTCKTVMLQTFRKTLARETCWFLAEAAASVQKGSPERFAPPAI
jgi:hypothetical protein